MTSGGHIAILTAWALLELVDLYPTMLMLVNVASTEDGYSLVVSAQDIFVAGIISFHLVVSSIGYFSTALGVVIGENLGSGNGLLKWPLFVINWVPPGPNQDGKSEG